MVYVPGTPNENLIYGTPDFETLNAVRTLLGGFWDTWLNPTSAQQRNGYPSGTTMQVNWRRLITTVGIWVIAEVLLTCMGLDNLADYSEFLDQRRTTILLVNR